MSKSPRSVVGSSLRELSLEREGGRKRISSYDRTGGNKDFVIIRPGSTETVANIAGAGCITHIWMTMMTAREEAWVPRKVVIRMSWDGEESPSVEAPIGDFFGMGHGIIKNFWSAPLCMSPQDGKGFNCFFPMPFGSEAKIEIRNECDNALSFYFFVDYEEYEKPNEKELRFHARWNRENPCQGISDAEMSNEEYEFGGKNTSGQGNYLILEAEGKGHYVGCNLNVHNLRLTDKWNWYGEGDDMIFVDGEKWPPTLHGTGTEDYFNTAFCPQQEYNSPYHGIILGGGPNWSGKVTLYRYHIADPIMFEKSIRVTIEHGHNNHRSDDVSSTAYWYQREPHKKFKPSMAVKERLPRPDILPLDPKKAMEVMEVGANP